MWYIWILQLWLNSILKPSFNTIVPPSLEVGVEGPSLAKLTPDDGNDISLEVFESYFQKLYRCKTFTLIMAPFSNRQCGPE